MIEMIEQSECVVRHNKIANLIDRFTFSFAKKRPDWSENSKRIQSNLKPNQAKNFSF